jgi:uncharacterized protein (TIGR03083 family)
MDTSSSAAFRDASRLFAGTVALVPSGAWDDPGLGAWSVRELVAHANRANTLIVEYVEHPRPPEPAGSGYFTEQAIAARASADAASLGDDPAGTVETASEAAISLVGRSAPEATVGSPAGTLTLAQYLPSRTAELAVHTLDLATAIGSDARLPSHIVTEALLFTARHAAARPSAQEVLLALTGRGLLPAGYSVY